jgi:autotransporter-associated beta strand protein
VAPLAVGAFTTTGTNTINISTTAPLTVGDIPLISYTGGSILGAGIGGLTLGSLPLRTSATLQDTTSVVNLHVTAVDSIRWNGGVNNVWDINSTANWKEIGSGNTTTYLQPTAPGEAVTFDDNAAGNFAVSAAVPVNPVSMTFNNNTNNYSFSGAGITTTALTTTGSGSVNVTGGNFTVGGTATLSGTGTFTISNSGSTFAATNMAINGGSVIVNRTDNVIGTSALATNISGSGAFTKQNTNIVELSGNNSSYTGTMTVSAGTLATRSTTALAATTVQTGATLDLGSTTTGTAAPTLPAGIPALKAVTVGGNGVGGLGALTVTTAGPNANGNNAHVGNLTLTSDTTIRAKSPGPTTSDNTNRAILWVEGTVTGNGNNLSVIVDTSQAYNTEIDFLNNGAMNVNNVNLSGGGVFYLGGSSDVGSTGTITLGDASTIGRLGIYGTSSGNGTPVAVTKPNISVSSAGGGIELYRHGPNNFDVTSSIAMGGDLDLTIDNGSNGTSTLTLSGPLTGTGNLTAHVQSNGSARLGMVVLTSENNTYSGTTTIGGGGGLYGSPTGVSASTDRVSLSIGNGGSTGSIGPGDVEVSGGAGYLVVNQSDAYTLANNISGTGNVAIGNTAGGTGDVMITGNNSYTGVTEVRSGHLILSPTAGIGHIGPSGTNNTGYIQMAQEASGALYMSGNVVLSKAAIYAPLRSVNSADLGPHIISASGNNEVTGAFVSDSTPASGNVYYTLQSNTGANLKMSGSIIQDKTGEAFLTLRGAGNGEVSGSILQPATTFFGNTAVSGNKLSVIKEGSGTWKISGTDNHTGTTTVNNGTLLVNTTHTVGDAYTVNSDLSTTFGTLGGTGTIGSAVTINQGGTLSPGAGVGTLTVASATFNTDTVNNSRLLIEYDNSLGQKTDKLVVTGALNIDGATLDFDNIGSGALNGSPLIIATYGSLAGTTNVFASILEMPATYSIDYHYLSGNQIAIVSSAVVAGDHNGDTKVNAADYVTWRKDQTGHGGPNGYATWRENFSQTAGSAADLGSAAGVPEPASWGLVLCALLGLLSSRSRRLS